MNEVDRFKIAVDIYEQVKKIEKSLLIASTIRP